MNKKLKIVFAADSFKGSLTSAEANAAMAEGAARAADIEPVLVPMSDGGDGLIDCLASVSGAELRTARVSGPLSEKVTAKYAVIGDRAVIEMAEASGIILTHGKNDPCFATTYGTGELIRRAIEDGASSITLGLGGSATTDGGMGALMALGARFFDRNGAEITRGCGLTAACAEDADFSNMITGNVRITILCDVDYTLLGERGAAAVFSPQKGADEECVKFLGSALENLARVICKTQKDHTDIPGTGAAGGLGWGLISVCNAELVPGMSAVMELIGFEEKISGADLVFTGEGRIDYQSSHGKAPGIIASTAKKHSIPTVVIGGCTTQDADELYTLGAALVMSASNESMTADYAMSHARALVADCARRAVLRLLDQNANNIPSRFV